MSYTYYLSGSPPYFQSVNQQLINGFNTALDQLFSQASDVWDITEEVGIGSGSFAPVKVRITTPIADNSYVKLGDDYKLISFNSQHLPAKLGSKYYFDDNYWIAVNTNTMKSLVNSIMVRRCNNIIRWIEPSTGIYYEEVCCLESIIARPRDEEGANSPVTPGGYVSLTCQMNERTKLIKGNQRFLFGSPNNRICFKVFGDGVRNFVNQKTLDDNSSQLLVLTMGGNYANPETDDLVLGIADRFINYGVANSGSSTGSYITVTPNQNYVLEGATTNFNVSYYSGSTIQTGSFVFSISGSNVPIDNYTFATVDGNNFTVNNKSMWLYNTLDVACVGSSGSKVLNLNLRGAW